MLPAIVCSFQLLSLNLQSCELSQARATHICLDCGYIYFLPKPFEEQVRFTSILSQRISLLALTARKIRCIQQFN